MKTPVQGGWVVSYRDGHHRMDRDHQVVYQSDQIIYTGPKFEGAADKRIDAAGKLICPGFIATQVHSGDRASHRLITDTGGPDYFGQPFLKISVPRARATARGDARRL